MIDAINLITKGPLSPSVLKLPLCQGTVSCGFPSPAEDYIEKNISLDDLLVRHPSATYFLRAKGDSMTGAGINSGDILVVDRSVKPEHNHIVVAAINGELLVKRLSLKKGRPFLVAENPSYESIPIRKCDGIHFWGVVTSVVHKFSLV